jgi:hypothetical protein
MRIFPTGRILFCFFSSSYRAINIFQRALIYYSPACRNSCFQFLSEFGVSVCAEVPVDLVLFFFQRFDSLLNNTGQLFELWIFSYSGTYSETNPTLFITSKKSELKWSFQTEKLPTTDILRSSNSNSRENDCPELLDKFSWRKCTRINQVIGNGRT